MATQTSKGTTVAKPAATASTLPPGPDGKKTAPKSNLPGAEGVEKKEKKLIEGITRGRMPIAVVFLVRFGDQKKGETKDLAPLFGTTVGKITDIKKCSTFAYLKGTFKPTAEQKADGIAWLQRHVSFKTGAVDVLINELEKMKVATADEAAAIEKERAAAKGQTPKTKEGKVADAGGGNRVKPAAKETEAGAKVAGKDLLK